MMYSLNILSATKKDNNKKTQRLYIRKLLQKKWAYKENSYHSVKHQKKNAKKNASNAKEYYNSYLKRKNRNW